MLAAGLLPYLEQLVLAVAAYGRTSCIGGSWTFVGLFAATMLVWVVLNALLPDSRGATFDPYPYILLNLFLSMLDRMDAGVDSLGDSTGRLKGLEG